MSVKPEVRLALPGKGALETATLAFLAECGMKVNRNNPRQYLASVSSMPDLEVVFQRAADIFDKVDEGSVDLGITGLDCRTCDHNFGPGNISRAVSIENDRAKLSQPLGHR